MNPLPALPLVDGCLFIDNSSWIEGMSTCYRYLQYKSLNLRTPSADKPSLNFGSAVHLALEHRYKKYRNSFVDDAYYNEVGDMLVKFYEEHPVAQDEWRTMNWAMTVIRKYNERYDIETFQLLQDQHGNPLVELSFAIPLMTWVGQIDGKDTSVPVIYSGRIDLPVHIADSGIFVMDHKTTSILGPTFFEKMKMSAQQKGYCWAFHQLTGQDVNGYIINAIRTKEPPQYVLNGKSSSKGKTQTPESWWQESLQRERYLLKSGDLEEWRTNTISLVDEFFYNYQRGYMPMKTVWCNQYGRCAYYDVCTLAAEDRGVMLASGLYSANTWSPLKQPSQSKQ